MFITAVLDVYSINGLCGQNLREKVWLETET